MNNPYISHKRKILSVKKETDLEITFRIESLGEPKSGQFYQVSIPKAGEAPISVSDFGEGWIEMTIRKVGRLTDTVFNLEAGDSLFLRGPYGKGFNLEELEGKHLILVTGGTGLAPVKSIINHFHRNFDKLLSFNMIMGFKNPASVIFKDELARWREKIKFILTVDDACGIWGDCVGLVTEYIKNIPLHDTEKTEVIVVGPPMMMKFSVLEFLKMGIPKEQVQVSFERNMSCALGKCGHCKIDETYICLEGPVFRYDKAEKLID